MTGVLKGRTALITGSSQGLGLAIARAYVKEGANVMMCARNAGLLDKAREEVAALAAPGQVVFARATDVSGEDDAKELMARTFTLFPRVHILVNNAGIYGSKGPIEEVDWGGWVDAVKVNLLGSVLMCRAVLPHFKKHNYGKIVQLSGGGATSPLPYLSAYAASKAAIVRFAETLAEEVRSFSIDVNSVAPGPLNTRLLDEVVSAGPEKVGAAFYERALKQKAQGGVPLENGAALCVFLSSGASDGITGRLLSAVWDPWKRLSAHREELSDTDIYTLRRIVPGDRGKDWDR